MEIFNEYHKNPKQFPFLKSFQMRWQSIRNEFMGFMNHASDAELKFASNIMGPKGNTIKTSTHSKYSAFGILFQGLLVEKYIQLYQMGKHYTLLYKQPLLRQK